MVFPLLIGCSDSNVPDSYLPSLSGHLLEISSGQLSFEARGGVENTIVHAKNVAWRFTGMPGWLTVSPSSGSSTSSVTFTAVENTSADTARTALFYLESAEDKWNYRVMVSANQKAAVAYISPALNSISFTGSGGSQSVKISSNVNWTATSSANWARVEGSSDGGSLTIGVEPNISDVSRTTVVTLSSASGTSSYIDVTQEPAGVTGSTETLAFENDGGTKTITITADADWEANTSSSWIAVSPSSGEAGNHVLTVKVLENNSIGERTGNVYVSIGGIYKLDIPIFQRGIYIEVNPASVSFSADAETKQIEVNSNTNWIVASLPEWLTASTMTGNRTRTITLTTQRNPNTSVRSGKVRIEKEGVSLFAYVDVLQEGIDLSVDQNNLQFTDKASSQDVVINTVAEWSALSLDGWIHLSRSSGIGKSTLTISVDENTEENQRIGSVKITAAGLSQIINVTQQGKYFTLNDQEAIFNSKGGTHQISFSTNEDWTAILPTDVSWLTLSKTSGSGDATIVISVSDNASMYSRECSIYIKPSNSQGVIVSVKQNGRYLSLDCEEIKFVAEGGSSDIVHVSTDGTFEVASGNSWLTIKDVTSLSFYVKASANEGKKRQGVVSVKMTGLANGETYKKEIFIEQEGIDLNGHVYVDLGLPSKTLWATCNLGASSPNEKGSLYAWGESTPRTDFSTMYSDYVYSNPYSDAATIEWGANWCTPTKTQMEELVNLCEWRGSYSGIYFMGYYVYGPNGKSIFLPADCDSDQISGFSRFWTKTLYTNDRMAYHLRIGGSTGPVVMAHYRYMGAAIRPVFVK